MQTSRKGSHGMRILVAFLALLSLAGAAGAQRAPVELAIYGAPDFYEEVVARFHAQHPDVEVTLSIIPGNQAGYLEAIPVMIAGGVPPDLGVVAPNIFDAWASQGVLQSLQPFIDRDGFDTSVLFPRSTSDFRYQPGSVRTGEGPLYAIPVTFQTQSMFIYNVPLFDQAGLAYPGDDFSWESMLDAARKLTRDHGNDGVMDQWGINPPAALNGWVWPFIESAGGKFISDDYTRMAIRDEPALRALEWLYEFATGYDVTSNVGWLEGKHGMYVVGQFAVHLYRWHETAPFEWDVAHYPKNPVTGGRKVNTASDAIAMFSGARNPEAAWTFLKFLAGEELQSWAAETYARPVPHIQAAVNALYNDRATGVPGGVPRSYRLMREILSSTVDMPRGLYFSEIQTNSARIWGQIIRREVPFAQGIGEMEQLGNIALNRAWEEAGLKR